MFRCPYCEKPRISPLRKVILRSPFLFDAKGPKVAVANNTDAQLNRLPERRF